MTYCHTIGSANRSLKAVSSIRVGCNFPLSQPHASMTGGWVTGNLGKPLEDGIGRANRTWRAACELSDIGRRRATNFGGGGGEKLLP